MPVDELRYSVEAILFSSRHPVSLKKISGITGAAQADVKTAIEQLKDFYVENKRAFYICSIAGGFQLRTDPKYYTLISDIQSIKVRKFSQAALEVMSIVAYKQPVTRALIDSFRTVDSGYAIKSLLEKNLIRIIRRDVNQPGHPIIYGTTDYFLEVFGFDSISDLPPVEELDLPYEEEIQEDTETVDASADLSIVTPEPVPSSTEDAV